MKPGLKERIVETITSVTFEKDQLVPLVREHLDEATMERGLSIPEAFDEWNNAVALIVQQHNLGRH